MLDGGAHTKRKRKMSYNCHTGTVQCLITAVQALHNIRTSKDVKTWTENDPCPGKSTAGFGTCSATRTDEAKVGNVLRTEEAASLVKPF